MAELITPEGITEAESCCGPDGCEPFGCAPTADNAAQDIREQIRQRYAEASE